MEHPVATSNCLVEIVGDSIDIESRMVGKNVDNHFHIIFRCRIEHLLHFLARSDNSVSYLPVGRLIIVIPRAVFTLVIENFGDFSLGIEMLLHRRSLKHCVAGVCNSLHIVGDGGKIPTPDM